MAGKESKGKLREWLRRWWVALVVCVPIVAGGIIFIIFALSKQLIDAESGRYLLSAIVQALAALLAIIFAGVAILWGHETQVVARLEQLKPKYNEKFKKDYAYFGSTGLKLVEATRNMLLTIFTRDDDSAKKEIRHIREQIGESPLSIFRKLSSWMVFLKEVKSEEFQKDIEKVANNYRENKESIEIKGEAEFLKETKNVGGFFRLIMNVNNYVSAAKTILGIESSFRTVILTHDKIKRWMVEDGIDHLLDVIERGRRARGGWFKFLISLYAVTIAGGMVALAVMKGGDVISGSAATWVTAGPLAFAIGAVALTFIYLYNLVKGGKE